MVWSLRLELAKLFKNFFDRGKIFKFHDLNGDQVLDLLPVLSHSAQVLSLDFFQILVEIKDLLRDAIAFCKQACNNYSALNLRGNGIIKKVFK